MRHRARGLLLGALTGLALGLILAVLVGMLGIIALEGAPALDWAFLAEGPAPDLSGGGIAPAILGTAALTVWMSVLGLPLGLSTGVYFAEYARRRDSLARALVHNLAGVPSIVYGLFGLGFFVLFVGRGLDAVLAADASRPVWGRPSLLWAACTLAVLTLPVVAVATESALRAVPRDLREAARALGATRIQVLLHVVLPHARARIATGVIFATSRAMGEVAPLLFLGAAYYLPEATADPRTMFMHLGHHVYVLATQARSLAEVRGALVGIALVLLGLTLLLNLVAVWIRARAEGHEEGRA